MVNIDMFSTQHKEIMEMADGISHKLHPDVLARDAAGVRSGISRLAGKLSVHLIMEDKSLYPDLLSHPNARVQQLARLFMEDMGGLAESFREYREKWAMAGRIRENPEAFASETRVLFSALAARIRREDMELYPILKDR